MVEPAAELLTPLDLATTNCADEPMVVATVAVLLAALVSLVDAVGATVSVLVTEVAVDKAALTLVVTVTVQNAEAGALVKVPVITVAPPTTALAVLQLPPPVMAEVMLSTGVNCVGMLSLKVADPVPPTAELLMVSTYCMV